MRALTLFSVLLSVFIISTAIPVYAVDFDWSDPDSIDPFAEGIGDFLDTDVDEIKQAAWDFYSDGDYETAAKYYLALLHFNVTDGSSIYNLACCYGLLGEEELAAEFIENAFNAGYTDVDWISWDPDFDSVREGPIFALTLAGLMERVSAEESQLGDLVYLHTDGFYECRIMLPDNFDPEKSYTLLIGLHGYGSNIDRFITLYNRFENHDFIYATPRAPFPFFSGSDLGYSWNEWDPNDEDFWARNTTYAINYVGDTVHQLKARYNVDEVYLLGFSQGCSLAYMAGITYHEMFDGMICFGGWLDNEYLDEEAIIEASDTRVFIGHATDDSVVEFESGLAARDLLESIGYDVTMFEFTGGHSVPEVALRAVERWMKGMGEGYVYF